MVLLVLYTASPGDGATLVTPSEPASNHHHEVVEKMRVRADRERSLILDCSDATFGELHEPLVCSPRLLKTP